MAGQGPLQRQSPLLTGRSQMRTGFCFFLFSCLSEGQKPGTAIGFLPKAFGPGIPFEYQPRLGAQDQTRDAS